MNKIDYDIVIWADFIQKYRTIINIAENTLLYRKNEEIVEIRMLWDVNRDNNNDLRTVTKISIPLKSSKLAEMRTNGVSQMENVFIEPTPLKKGFDG